MPGSVVARRMRRQHAELVPSGFFRLIPRGWRTVAVQPDPKSFLAWSWAPARAEESC